MLKTELYKLSDIKKNPNNPRVVNDDKFKKLVASIKEFPKMLEIRPIVVNNDNIVLGGNMRLKACKEAGLKEIPVIKAEDLTEEQQKQFIIKDNVGFGEWDWEMLASEWDTEELADWGLDVPDAFDVVGGEGSTVADAHRKLTDIFGIPPFTVLDTRQGYWADRKKTWKDLINDKGESRQGTLASEDSLMGDINSGVSILDPVLAEIAVRWFSPDGSSSIFDCFAGDTVFGYVASYLGNRFTGIELREEQASLNNTRVKQINSDSHYFCDDGQNVADHIHYETQDLLFSCPPYYDLEVYSDKENDASNQETYEDFLCILENAFKSSIKCLKVDRFAFIVVGDIRDKNGFYYRFHDDIKRIFTNNGMGLYNELVLVEPLGTLPQRVGNSMKNRKIGKCHQNVLVFYKGDPKNIKNNFSQLDFEKEMEAVESTNVQY